MAIHTSAERRRDAILDRLDSVESAVSGALTTEDVQDTVGAMLTDSSTIDFTYNDPAGTLTAIVKDGSITSAKLDTSYAAASHTHAESDITGLTSDLALKAPLASPTFTGTVTLPSGQALVSPALGTPASGVLTNMTGVDAWRGVVITTADQSLTASYADLTPASGPSLGFPVVAGGTYKFKFGIWTIADATTTGMDCAINGPTIGAGSMVYRQGTWSSLTAQSDTRATTYDNDTAQQNSQGAANRVYYMEGHIVLGATGGTVVARVKRENVGSGTAKAGSFLEWQRVS